MILHLSRRGKVVDQLAVADVDKSQVLDGSIRRFEGQLGGYFLIDVPDQDTALSWAARCPGARHGVVEVRPIRVAPE